MKIQNGDKFGILTVVSEGPKYVSPQGQVHRKLWCICECGAEKLMRSSDLHSGQARSCGCKIGAYIHGHTTHMDRSPTYDSWASMIQRCNNQNAPSFKYYGGRGVSVCDEWLSFEEFLKDMGVRPLGATLDRFPNNSGNYEPLNCRWATRKDQARNRKSNVFGTMSGKTQCLADWALEFGIHRGSLSAKVKEVGMEQALIWGSDPTKRRKYKSLCA